MGLNQSYRQMFVSNSSVLLAQGKTVETLGVGQIGIIDEKTKTAVTAPTYATNKAVKFVWGTPDLTGRLTLMTGVPNENIYSKLVKGRKIVGWRGKAAKRGKNEVVVAGFSGAAGDTETLTMYPGETRHLFVNLSGAPIDKFYSKQGLMRQYSVTAPYTADCGDDCTAVNAVWVANELVKQINSDPQVNRFIKATVVQGGVAPVADDNCYRFEVSICDTRDDIALGLVQAQYPNDQVTRARIEGANSVYQVTRATNSLPAAVSNAGNVLLPNCDVCPAGYLLEQSGFVFTAVIEDADADISATIESKIDGAHVGASTSATKVSNDNYVIVTQLDLTPAQLEAAIEGGGGPTVTSITFKYETNRNFCILQTATTTAWSLAETLDKFIRNFRITVADTVCGDDRLADIQAAYPDYTVTLVNAAGDCVHIYNAEVMSECVSQGCSVENIVVAKPVPFEGIDWVEVPVTYPSEQAGVKIESVFVNRITGECTYDHFTYEADPVHIYASSFDPDYNNDGARVEWTVKKIQGIEYPAGHGVEIRKFEEESNRYQNRHRSFNPVVNEIEGHQFITDPNKFYDEYVVEFEFDYKVGGWTNQETDRYHLFFYFPEGTGKAFETAINDYIASIGLPLDAVVL